MIKKIKLSDEGLDKVLDGVDNNHDEYTRKQEIELGELVPDAYKPANKNPNELDLLSITI